MRLARLYFETKKYQETDTLLNDIIVSLDTLPENTLRMRWLELKSQLTETLGDKLGAYVFYKKYISLKDSLASLKKTNNQTDILREINEKEQQYHIQLLVKDRYSRQVVLYISLVFAALTLLIIAYMFFNYIKSNRKNILIKRQTEMLELSVREKDRILGVVAHDLYSPLSGIVHWVDLALKDGDLVDYKDGFMIIKGTLVHSIDLINELVGHSVEDYSKLTKELLNVNEILADIVSSLSTIIAAKEQKVALSVPKQPAYWLLNKEKFTKAITNLIENASKFTNVGGSIFISLTMEQNKLVLLVRDNGIGIPDKLKIQLFEMFSPAKRLGTKGEKSFGLGLAICKQIIKAHNGTIRVSSKVGEGSEFTIELLR
jgi:signal transduction histidine kinase